MKTYEFLESCGPLKTMSQVRDIGALSLGARTSGCTFTPSLSSALTHSAICVSVLWCCNTPLLLSTPLLSVAPIAVHGVSHVFERST